MASATRLRPSPKRNYLWIALIALLALISVILIYRAITGSTIKDQKALAQAAKAAEDLQNLPPANAESLSAKLEAARLEAEKQRVEQTARDAAANAPAPEAPPAPAPSAAGAPRQGGIGIDLGLPTDEELDNYERNKAAQQATVAAKPPTSSLIEPGRRRTEEGAGALPMSALAAAGIDPRQLTGAAGAGSGSAAAPSQTGLSPALAAQIAGLLQPGSANPQVNAGAAPFRQQLTAQNAVQQPVRLQEATGPARFLVFEGTSIPVSMGGDVSSDIAGECKATVAQDVLDSVTLTHVLIPAGSRLICTYDEGVVQGQDKLLLAFTRLILPNGDYLPLVDMTAADRFGAAGAPAKVNSRFWSIFGNSFVIAAVTRLAEPKQSSTGTVTINTGAGGGGGATAATVLAETSKKVLERNLNVKPELRLHAGDHLRLTVTRDMVVEPVSASGQSRPIPNNR